MMQMTRMDIGRAPVAWTGLMLSVTEAAREGKMLGLSRRLADVAAYRLGWHARPHPRAAPYSQVQVTLSPFPLVHAYTQYTMPH